MPSALNPKPSTQSWTHGAMSSEGGAIIPRASVICQTALGFGSRLRIRELAGRHAGLAAGDAKWMSEMQNNIVACMRSANMPNGRPTCRRGSPRCKTKPRTTTYYHIRPRTTTYYHVLPRTITYYHKRSFCISGSHPCMSASQFPFSFTELLFTNLLPY